MSEADMAEGFITVPPLQPGDRVTDVRRGSRTPGRTGTVRWWSNDDRWVWVLWDGLKRPAFVYLTDVKRRTRVPAWRRSDEDGFSRPAPP